MSDGYNVWDSFAQGQQIGGNIRATRNRAQEARAYQTGGAAAASDTAGRLGDFQTMATTRQFADERQQHVYDMLEKVRPWILPVIQRARQLPPDQARAFLNNPQFRTRLNDIGLPDELINQGIDGLANTDDAIRDQTVQNLTSEFTQHQNPNWTIRGNQVIGVDPQTGAVSQGGTLPQGAGGRYATDEEVAQSGFAPHTVVWIDANQVPHVVQQPHYDASGRGQYSELPPGFEIDQ